MNANYEMIRVQKLTRDELCFVARVKNWKRGNASKQAMIDYFLTNGMTAAEILQIVRDAKAHRAATPVATAVAEIGRADVERLIEEKLRAAELTVDSGVIGKLIAEAVAKAQPARIVIDGDKPPVKIAGRTHPVFEKTLRLVRAGLNVLLVGPAGCGKTTLAHQLAQALKRRFGTLHCTSGASESQLTGWLLPVGEGKAGTFTYVASEFVELYEGGDSVFLLDEIDAADPNMLLVINSALSNGSVHIPQRHDNPEVKRGKNVAVIAAANTFGTGADAVYAGRNQLDGATLDRFYVIEMGYDEALEEDFVIAAEAVSGVRDLFTWVRNLRRAATQHRLRRVVSTRMIQKGIAALTSGIDVTQIRRDLLAGWTSDELTKVGVAS